MLMRDIERALAEYRQHVATTPLDVHQYAYWSGRLSILLQSTLLYLKNGDGGEKS
jgi:hypothetical protein